MYNLTTNENRPFKMTSGTRERRWIILAEDGRHSTIGRHTDPSEAELVNVANALTASGQGGWLAVTEGQYYLPHDRIAVMLVRELSPTHTPWETAVEAFQAARRRAIAPTG